jgi:phage-related protein
LLISTLPPISKPKVRVSLEEIDGRDGDIATILGYAAYDKVFNIGLYGDYIIDDVIKFFDCSGKVIFSNEDDKFYNFAIYDAIDFDKLIRFKTATVKMHVQPFKYSVSEPIIDYSIAPNTWEVRNSGNIYSKPIITLSGTGVINLTVNATPAITINLTDANETIIIDTQTMNAYDLNGNFKNREIIGDYRNLQLKAGKNIITASGTVNNFKIADYSRWI